MIVNGKRALAHTEKIEWVRPIEGADNIELVGILGWVCIAKIGEFKEGDTCVYIEIDSKVPEKEWSEFLRKKHFKVKTMKLGKFNVVSQGLALPIDVFDVEVPNEVGIDVTDLLGITYSIKEDNKRKNDGPDKYKSMAARKPYIFKQPWARWFMRREWGRKLMFLIFGRKKDNNHRFPNHFAYIHKTDQERCENMPWVLEDKTPFIRTQKCDGSSATYILERKKGTFKNKYEFYVCSRNVRMLKPDQETFFGDDNPYWDMAIKYNIEHKLRQLLDIYGELDYICWQGEICGPKIQKNPHKLTENHLFLFHMIDSEKGMYDIIEASIFWTIYNMEFVPIEHDLYTLPDDFEEFKLTADGYYDSSVCEGHLNCRREGYVYYKSNDPNFSFKNVSREYLLKRGE